MTPAPHDDSRIDQACAVPFRRRGNLTEVCLITSSAGKWIFPKGYVEGGESEAGIALLEAEEEAGLHGEIIGEPLGCIQMTKRRKQLTVIAFLMKVSRTDVIWNESHRRERRWVSLTDAAELVTDAELLDLLQATADRIAAECFNT